MNKKIVAVIAVLLVSLACSVKSSAQKLKVVKAVASSVENGNQDLSADKAVDGDSSNRWAADWKDPQWIYFDLGKPESFNFLTILWENAYCKVYDIQVSDDANSWRTVFSENNGDGKKDIINLGNQKARYVRIFGKVRGTAWGYSIHEVSILNCDSAPPAAPSNLTILKGDGLLALKWDKNREDDVYAYNLYRGTEMNGELQKVNEKPVDNITYVDKEVTNGTRYYYAVKALDYPGSESKASQKISETPSLIGKKGTYLDAALSVENRVKDLLSRMTLEEKVDQAAGMPGGDDMTTYDNKRLGIPSIRCADGPWGVRWGSATAFPVSIAVASSWNSEIARKIGVAIGKELKSRGRNQSLGPCLNLAKDPRGGRVHEGYGEDVYLTSKMAVAAIVGLQSQKVIATAKHFACNNVEKGRDGGPVVIDERTLREIFLPAFKACIKKGNAWSVMGAYNKVNGEYACANKHLLVDILKNEWGFKGFVISDWFGCHSTAQSANSGLDLEMPFAKFYGVNLLNAVKDGQVSEKTIDDIAGRMLRAKFLAGLFEEESKEDKNKQSDLGREHKELAKEAARAGIVLLKNENAVLPLDMNKIKTIAVLGPNARKTTAGEGLGSGQVSPSYAVTPFDGIRNKVGSNVRIVSSANEADVAIVFVGLAESIAGRVEGEGTDRDYLHLPGNQDSIIVDASRSNKKTIVVFVGGSAITMDKWINQVPGVVQAWYCGQEGGNAIADVLFGDYNPGGKLPITFPKSLAQLPPFDWDYKDEWKTGIGYCYFDKKNLEPLFPFGYGLSYTKFEYSNLKIEPKASDSGNINISVDIKNIGKREGDEVVQLYLQDEQSSVERPSKQLKGFKRLTLKPGETKKAEFKLTAEDLAFYNKEMKFVVEPGNFNVLIGSSSRDIRFKGSFNVTKLISKF